MSMSARISERGMRGRRALTPTYTRRSPEHPTIDEEVVRLDQECHEETWEMPHTIYLGFMPGALPSVLAEVLAQREAGILGAAGAGPGNYPSGFEGV